MNDKYRLLMGMMDEESENRKTVRAAFKMNGAKTRLLSKLIPVLNSYIVDRWVDHCGGTGVVSWNVKPCRIMVYNDRYSAVADFYLALRDREEELKEELMSLHPMSRQVWEHCRDHYNTETDQVKRSALWYYMVLHSYLGKKGQFDTDKLDCRDFLATGMRAWPGIRSKINRFRLENMNVFDSLKVFDYPDTLHYIDIPYVGTDQEGYTDKWDEVKAEKLIEAARSVQGTVAFSHIEHPVFDAEDWDATYHWEINAMVSGKPTILKENLYVIE